MNKKVKKDLDKLLIKSLKDYKEKRPKNFSILFLIITFASLAGVIISIACLCGFWRDFLLAISSGLFGSGLYATAIELLNIRNSRALKFNILSDLRFNCASFIEMIGDGVRYNESHNYFEWVELIVKFIDEDSLPPEDVFYRLDFIIRSCQLFGGKKSIDFGSANIDDETLLAIRHLGIQCSQLRRCLFKKESSFIARILFNDQIKKSILTLFPDLEDKFNEPHSFLMKLSDSYIV